MIEANHQQKGSALLVVLAIIVISTILISTLVKFSLKKYQTRYKQHYETVALYIAESGIAMALHQDKFSTDSTSVIRPLDEDYEETEEELSSKRPTASFSSEADEDLTETGGLKLKYHLNPFHPKPQFESYFEGEYLKISSTGTYRGATITVEASFGRALNDSIFSSALVLDLDS